MTSIHTALDSLRGIMSQHGLRHADIASVEVGCGHMTHVHTAWPYRPEGITSAQMNLFFGLGLIATGGSVGAGDFTEARLRDPLILDFIRRVSAHEDAELEAMGPEYRHACRMVVTTRDGRRLPHEELRRRGSPENPVTFAELEAKFRANLAGLLSEGEMRTVVDAVGDFETLRDVGPVVAVLSKPRPHAPSRRDAA
ncbi:2-methylcitrate dehydratase PrpD [Roseomonas pecuniae]|uniref:2-methylcitrate dehydratase PrpD n=1 Tax=Muricoccus pecuniae TaxID=693023 RepID=A0A840Y4X8_9PROT|nr:2-methylcitrate dehydratase PrpD [Roseomonas pecuniae]